MGRSLTLLFVFPLMLLISCSPKERSGGSVVGNGMIRFYNPFYRYSFAYDDRLTLKEESQEIVSVEDRRLADDRGQAVSKVMFEVVTVPAMESKDLETYANGKRPEYSWKGVEITGVKGFVHRASENLPSNADYIFLLGPNSILEVHVDLGSMDLGAELIAGIIDSLMIDIQAPVIEEAYFDPPLVHAGEFARLKIRARDGSGIIDGHSPNGSVDVGRYEKCHYLSDDDFSFPVCGEFHSLGNDWYEFAFPIPPRTRSGSYRIRQFTLWDGAGNPASVFWNGDKLVADWSVTSNWSKSWKPFVPLQIENNNADLSPPDLANLHFEPAVIRAGESGKLVFDVSDDDPDFSVNVECGSSSLFPWTSLGSIEDIPDNEARLPPRFVTIPLCGVPRLRGGRTWELDFRTEAHMAEGRYSLFFSIYDAAFNSSKTMASLQVKNAGSMDRDGPTVLEVKALKTEYARGETVTVMIRAVDESGVIGSLYADTCSEGLSLHSANLAYGESYNNLHRIPLCASQFHPVGGDWYAFELKLGENIPSGEYRLEKILLSDRLGNWTELAADYGSYPGETPRYKVNSILNTPTEAKVLTIHVVR